MEEYVYRIAIALEKIVERLSPPKDEVAVDITKGSRFEK